MAKLKAWVFLVVGSVLVVAALATGLWQKAFIRGASSAEGVVTRLNAGGSHPQIEFATTSGEKVSYPQGGFIFGYRPGEKVRVLYDPDDPGKVACIDAFGAIWFAPTILSVLGISFVVAGIACFKSQAPGASGFF